MIATAAEASANAEAAATAKPRKRTLWIIGSTAASFAMADPIVEQIRLLHPRLDLIFTSRDPSLSGWLRERHPDSLVNDLPSAFAALNLRAVRRHNPRLMLLLDGVTRHETALLRAARRRQIPIALLATGMATGNEMSPELLSLVERYVALDTQSLAALAARGVAPARIIDATGGEPTDTAAETLSALLRRDLKALRSEHAVLRRALEGLALAAVDHPWLRHLTGRRAQRIDTLDDLAARLAHPRTILCLGNGPSSEDPRVRDLAHDALFRVNHLWQERDALTHPDLVFTGSADSVRRLDDAIVAISLMRHEGRLLIAGITRRHHPFRFVTLERLGILVPQSWWGDVVPTNGACMLATAVALRPARLIVAGIDLFRHQDGAYPGDPRTPNAYTPRHAAELDERVILETLDGYRGELVIIGDVLAALWRARHERAGPTTGPAGTVVTASAAGYAQQRRRVA